MDVAGATFETLVTQRIESSSESRRRAVKANENNTALFPNAASFQAALDTEAALKRKLLDNLQHRSIAECQPALAPLDSIEQVTLEGAPLLPPLNAWPADLLGAALSFSAGRAKALHLCRQRF